jgi:hypothetical protein
MYTATMNGIPFGRVDLIGAPRATGILVPSRAYESLGVRSSARRLGQSLQLLGARRIGPPVRARTLAAALARQAAFQDRFGLEDRHGMSIAIVHMIVAEFPREPAPRIVVELREQAAPIGSRLRDLINGPGDSSRPAA